MDQYSQDELLEAIRAITSMIKKSEKALLKLPAGTWQHTMTVQTLTANHIAIALLNRELAADSAAGPLRASFTEEELRHAFAAITTIIGRVEKILPKFNAGTPQHTLAVRRIKALNISLSLLRKELNL